MSRKILRLLSCIALILAQAYPAFAQNRVITGKVIDSTTSDPLPGVTIAVEGGRSGTVTDADGSFRLTVPQSGRMLTFSSISYTTQTVPVTDQNTLLVKLVPSGQELQDVEVVSVGYGTLDKREVSSAITHVTARELKTVAGNNPLMSLQGKVAGLTISNTATADPNSSPSIQLRGVSSRSAGLGPLYVINGVPGGNIDNINQNDIESIDVLKGGAASAIYGTRGSNGVVIITTKKGTGDSKMIYDGYVSFDYLTNTPDVLSASDFRKYRVNATPARGIDYGGNTDWMKAVTRSPTYGQKHTLQLSGGTARNNYFASADYRNANGIDLRAYKKEYGGRLNLNHTSKSNVYTVTLNVAPRYMHTSNSDQGNFNNAITLNPTLPVNDSAGGYRYINTGFFSNNPVENARLIKSEAEIKELDMNASLKVNILKNLYSTVTISDIRSSYKNLNFRPSTLTTIVHAGQTTKTNYASQEQVDYDQQNIEWTFNYALNIRKNHFKALGGYSYSYFNHQQFSANNYDFPFDVFLWNNLGSGTWNGGDKGNGQGAVASTQDDSRLAAFYGRINYDFDNKYILTASLRHEGSSKFGADNKWGNFPALSAAWRISDEDFLKNKVSWLNDLKLRADYGVTGNQDFGNYLSLLLYGGYGYFPFDGITYQVYGPAQNINPNLGWEKAINFNAGIDFEILNSRISGSLNYYVRTNKDLLGYYNVPLPPNPQSQTFTNVGTMKNSGFEVQLSAAAVKHEAFSYNISFTTAYNDNKFVSFSNKIYQGAPFQDMAGLPAPGSPGTIQRLQEGHRIGDFYMLKSAGVDETGALLVYKKDGTVVPANEANADDKQFVGNGLPKFTGSLGNLLRYKNWDLNIFLRGNFGYKLFNMQAFYIGTPATQTDANTLRSAYDSKSKYSKLTNSSTASLASDYFLESGSFVKVDNITLGYSRPVSSKYLQAIRIYAAVSNLHTFTRFTGGDPDLYPVNGLTPGVQGNPSTGYSLNFYPATLQLLAGLQVTF
ncbi:SusC/RagA family TonB-linked outer membrane protein [Niabella ginsenosidivorans]|uniref:SusC/RagA family TonB-linked outer membrane protein n=1 Tax=Niabella ginsenosidivorans TaxID=1176587 RepID=A0A1A9IAM2_9BACT|nr:SusC/RagA family TonB-linked outer membrane protein [Niabella ginsenosidivorans]ANH83772.1 SusC/RagA family TonB-linked outer membrane protein [Niabella ginsenosidivorans]